MWFEYINVFILLYLFPVFFFFYTFPTFGELCICLADINPGFGFGGKTGKGNFQSAVNYFCPQQKYESWLFRSTRTSGNAFDV